MIGPLAGRTIAELLAAARRQLAAAPFRPSPREARLLLGRVLERGEAELLAHGEEPVPAAAAARFQDLLARRLRGEPVAYLVGEREFYGRDFVVDRRVLIPRPETEHLIAAALELDLPAAPRILDLGTGSGCIAVTLALELPRARLVATDVSLAALRVLRANCRRHGVADRVAGVCGDLGVAVRLEALDLVVSNPPYVDPGAVEELSPEVREFEPALALLAPGYGHSILERLLAAARGLRPGAHLVVEIGYDQGDWLRDAARAATGLELVEIRQDYAGIARTAILRRLTRRGW